MIHAQNQFYIPATHRARKLEFIATRGFSCYHCMGHKPYANIKAAMFVFVRCGYLGEE